MTSLSLVFDLLARDQASGAFRNVGNAAQQAGQQTSVFSSAIKTLGVSLTVGGVVAGLKSLYQAADESRKIAALTAQVIKSTGGAAQVSAQQVGDLAAQIAKKTGVDDEAIQSGENLLLTFTNIKNQAGAGNDIFNQTTKIMTDMSVALGTDASGSAIQLGKALNDPIKGVTALQKVGVSFTASQKEQIATLVESGDVLGAQKVILAELGKEFGGAAEAASTPLGKLQQRLGNLAEEVGGYLVPAVDKAATFFNDKLLPGFTTLAPAAGVVVDAFTGLASIIGDLIGFVAGLPGPVLAGVGALVAFNVLGPLVIRTASQISFAWGVMAAEVAASTGVLAAARGAMAGLIGFLGGPWGLAFAAAVTGISLLVSWLGKSDDATKDNVAEQSALADALRQSKGALDANVRAAAAKEAQDKGILDVAKQLGIPLSTVTDAILGQGNSLNEVQAKMQAYINTQQGFNSDTTAGGLAAIAAKDALAELGGQTEGNIVSAQNLADATARTGEATSNAATLTQDFANRVSAAREELDAGKTAIDDFKFALDLLTGAHVSAIELESQFQSALDAAEGAMADLGGTALDTNGNLDLQSEAGRKAADVLLDIRNSGNELIATMEKEGATAEQVQAKDAQLRESFIASAGQMGINQDQAKILADQILGIPDSRNTEITADTSQATNAVNSLQALIDGLHGRTVDIIARAIMPDLNGSASGSGRMGTFAEGGYTGDGDKYTPAGIVHAGEFVFTKEQTRKAGVGRLSSLAKSLRGYAGGGVVAPASIVAELDTRGYESQMNAGAAQMLKNLEPVAGMIGALNWARTQVGKPYIWGGVGPAGYDCSGFMSAITNVIRGRSPYSRVGSTGNFPWGGFAGGYGAFTIGSTPNAGGGIGHMAGTLLGVNVESTGNHVRVGGDARGASNGLFSTRAHLAMANGGVIGEPVSGIGHYSGRSYSFGERGPETVTPGLPSGGPVEITGTLAIGGDGLARIIDGRIVARDGRSSVNARSSR